MNEGAMLVRGAEVGELQTVMKERNRLNGNDWMKNCWANLPQAT